MGNSVRISSPEAWARAELAEQLALAGYPCAEDAAVLVEDAGEALVVAGQRMGKPVRLAAVLTRLAEAGAPLILADGWRLRPEARVLAHEGGRMLALTAKETELLAALLACPGLECTRAHLLEKVWGYGDDLSTHTLETHMYRLRAKLKEALGGGERIETTAAGYRILL